MAIYDESQFEFEQIGACDECPGMEVTRKAAEQFMLASGTICFLVPREDSGVNRFWVPRGSAFDEPRPVQLRKTLARLATEMPDDPLRCAGGCILGEDGDKFWEVLDEVKTEGREAIPRISSSLHPSAILSVEDIVQAVPDKLDPIERFVNELFAD